MKSRYNSNIELFMVLNKSVWLKKSKILLQKKKRYVKKAKSLVQTISQHAMFLRSFYLNNKINLSEISLLKIL